MAIELEGAPGSASEGTPGGDASDLPDLSPAELRARRQLRWGLAIAAVVLLSIIALLVVLSINAYQATFAGVGPTPGEVVVSLLRDAAIIFVAFETLLIGVLLIILMIQVQSLVVLLRDEIAPMLEALNETTATVRGTTKFVSHNLVSPVMRWSGYVAGLKRMAQELGDLIKGGNAVKNVDRDGGRNAD